MLDGTIPELARPRPPRIVPLCPELYRFAAAGERDPLLAETYEGAANEALCCNQWGYALIGRGYVLAAGGLVPYWAGRAKAWLLVNQVTAPRDLVPALRHARQVLDKRQRDPFFRRIEIEIRWDAPWRESFAAALGFQLETRARAWGPGGIDYGLYARVAE